MSAADGGSETYKKLQEKLLNEGESPLLFEDKQFPANHRSLQRMGINPNIVWKRPHEIVKNPVFMREATYYDLHQGELGNCWFLAAVNVLMIQSPSKFQFVVPHRQTFTKGKYTGLFRFNFWQYGEWTEVLVDDFLPVSRVSGQLCFCWNRKEPEEFWCSLLEKAYAKLYGNYMQLDSGLIHNALVDMTGGISERIELKEDSRLSAERLFGLLQKMWTMNTMIGLVIFNKDGSERQRETAQGLIEDHAYAVTKLATVKNGNEEENILRIRNPWGRVEWNGRWSDKSKEWSSLTKEEKTKLGLVIENEGEFWMSIRDVIKYFDLVDLCHQEEDAMLAVLDRSKNQRKNWVCSTYKDNWVHGISDGGSDRKSQSYWTNPQFVLDLSKEKNKTNVIISLVEIMDRNKSRMDVFTGFDVYKIDIGTACPLTNENYDETNLVFEKRASETEWRENTLCMEMDPSKHVVIPYTQFGGKASRFLLRIFAEKEIDFGSADHVMTEISDESLVNEKESKFFSDGEWMDAFGLDTAVELLRQNDPQHPRLTLEASRCLLALLDEKRLGMVESAAAEKVHQFLTIWHKIFKDHKDDNSELMDVKQLRKLYKQLGFIVSRKVMEVICKRYANAEGEMGFDDFVQSTTRMMSLFRLYKEQVRKDRKSLTLSKWMELTLYL